jgi:hypothetical protein
MSADFARAAQTFARCSRQARRAGLTGRRGNWQSTGKRSREKKKGLGGLRLTPCFIGAVERSRTSDLLITNQLLYQLSYISTNACQRHFRGPNDINAAGGCPVPRCRPPARPPARPAKVGPGLTDTPYAIVSRKTAGEARNLRSGGRNPSAVPIFHGSRTAGPHTRDHSGAEGHRLSAVVGKRGPVIDNMLNTKR